MMCHVFRFGSPGEQVLVGSQRILWRVESELETGVTYMSRRRTTVNYYVVRTRTILKYENPQLSGLFLIKHPLEV